MNKTQLNQIIELIYNTEALVILAGAGMSADSGIPTYRGENGTWGKYEQEFEKHITEIMTPQFIQENPVYMWKRFSKGWNHLKKTNPHDGYFILLDWIQRFELPYFIVTSNVDRQFAKTGFEEEKIYEVHGASGYLQCTTPCRDTVWQEDYGKYDKEDLQIDDLPKCPHCGKLVRPNVFIFKDKTFVSTRVVTQKDRFAQFLSTHQSQKIVAFEIGAGSVVKTIRNLTQQLIRQYQATTIRINRDDAHIELPHFGIAQNALDTLQEIHLNLT